MEINKVNDLSFYNDQGILTIPAKQFDTGRKFTFNIIADDEPFDLTGCSVYLRVLKADNKQFQSSDCCSISGNSIIVDTSVSNGNQLLTTPGKNKCELHLQDSGGKALTTWDFIIEVIARVHNNDHLTSTDSWDEWDKMVDDVHNLEVNLDNHKKDYENPHKVTKKQVGLDNVDNTSDKDKPVSTAQQTALDKKADISSPTLTGTPKAPTASAGTNSEQIATTAFVQTAVSDGIAASDAMIFKGTIGTTGTIKTLPATYRTGWTYRVVTNGTYAGQVCEIGDLVIALVDRTGTNNADTDWCVAQTNIDGAITGVKGDNTHIEISQSGSVVTIKHKDITRSNTTSTAKPSSGGTFTTIKTITSDAKGHITGVDTETVTIPSNADAADKLTESHTFQTDLSSTKAVAFDGSADNVHGVTGTLGAANGGTGKTNLKDAANALINALDTGTDKPTDNTLFITQNTTGTSEYIRRKFSLVWDYVKGKLATVATSGSYNDLKDKPTIPESATDTKVNQTASTANTAYPILLSPSTANGAKEAYFATAVTLNPSTKTIAANISGSSASCTGNAATATKATNDGSGNNIVNTYAKKADIPSALKNPQILYIDTISRINGENTISYDGSKSIRVTVPEWDLCIENYGSSFPAIPQNNFNTKQYQYIMFANGMMMMMIKVGNKYPPSSAGVEITVSFPVSFIDTNYICIAQHVVGNANHPLGYGTYGNSYNYKKTSSIIIYKPTDGGYSENGDGIHLFLWGRWK